MSQTFGLKRDESSVGAASQIQNSSDFTLFHIFAVPITSLQSLKVSEAFPFSRFKDLARRLSGLRFDVFGGLVAPLWRIMLRLC